MGKDTLTLTSTVSPYGNISNQNITEVVPTCLVQDFCSEVELNFFTSLNHLSLYQSSSFLFVLWFVFSASSETPATSFISVGHSSFKEIHFLRRSGWVLCKQNYFLFLSRWRDIQLCKCTWWCSRKSEGLSGTSYEGNPQIQTPPNSTLSGSYCRHEAAEVSRNSC